MEQPEQNIEHPSDGTLQRGLATDIALVAGPTIAVVADHAIESIKSRPAKEQPPQIILPPGTKSDG
jgi:hypothetical protein